jgi:hypothetical protein
VPNLIDEALCIRQWDWSETSQTVSLFCRTHGIVRGLAKGARRERSSFSGGIDLLARGEIVEHHEAEEVVAGWKDRKWLHEGGDYKVTLVYPRTGPEPARTRTVRGFRFHDAARLAVGDVATEGPRLVADEVDPFDQPDRADRSNPFGRR